MKTVLIVDDREENRSIISIKLNAGGYQAVAAGNGIEALRILRSEPVDIVVTDLMMPGMDGYQLTHVIKTDETLKRLPVVVYTATYKDPKDEALAYNLGANAFVIKPATDEEFFSTIGRMLELAKRNELPCRTPTQEELVYLRQYNERLIHKLEAKIEQLDAAQSELKKFNSTLQHRVDEATAELRSVNEELEAFAYSVSHDLRAPLRSIYGLVGCVRLNDPPLADEERQNLLLRVERLAMSAQMMINDLLDYARLKSSDIALDAVEVEAAVHAALENTDAAARSVSKIQFHHLSYRVVAHETTLIQVLQNLINNALKFTAANTPADVTVSGEQRGDVIRISVRDRGIGIESQHLSRIFNAFERLHGRSQYAGSGLGLAIVQRALHKMHGRLGVESKPGEGSIFWIELPRAQ